MHIERLEIERFGIFSDKKIGPLSTGLNLLTGPNEAGKTTLLRLVLDILFGFSTARAKTNDYRIHPEDRLGGRLILRVSGYKETLIVERYGTRGSGTVSLNLAGGGQPGQEYLEKLLGHLDLALYRNLFAFSLFELSDFESLNSEQLQARIYSAGTGTGAVAVPDLIASLEKERKTLFAKSGKKPLINELLDRLSRIEDQLADLSGNADLYDQTTAHREDLSKRLEGLNRQEKEVSGQLERKKTLLRLYETWVKYSTAAHELAALEKIPDNFPERARERLGELREQIKKESGEIEDYRQKSEKEKAEFVPDQELEKLNRFGKLLADLERGFNQFESAVRDLPRCESEMEISEQKLQRELRDLNPNWTVENLLGFDSSVPTRKKMSSLKERIETGERAVLIDGQSIRNAELDLSQPERSYIHYLLAFAACAALVAGVGWLWVGDSKAAGAAFLAMGLVFGLLWWLVRREKLTVMKAYGERLKNLDERKELYRKAETELEQTRKTFKELIAGLNLDPELNPEMVSEVFTLVEKARDTQSVLEGQRKRVSKIKECIEDYACRVNELFAALGEAPPGFEEMTGIVKQVLQQREKAREYDTEKKQTGQRLEFYAEELSRREKELERLLAQKRELVSVSAREDNDPQAEELFLRQAGIAEKRGELLDRQREARSQLLVAAGSKGELEAFLAELEKSSPESLEEQVAGLEEEKTRIKEETEATNRELGELNGEIQRLGDETRGSELRLERSVAVEELAAKAGEWAALSLALQALRKATERYERERQPEVLRQGQVFLGKMTAGRYIEIHAPLGERRFEVVSREGASLPPEKLSRGTAEQLYLALRFGLVRELSRHSEPLPVIMDDILVNFDPERAQAACEAIREMAGSHQVIYFTCHPHIVDLFLRDKKDTACINLEKI
ncbi:MAG TPA: AAA family ATPase [archaeon]|nr:AAA family ATPase [archaeon]